MARIIFALVVGLTALAAPAPVVSGQGTASESVDWRLEELNREASQDGNEKSPRGRVANPDEAKEPEWKPDTPDAIKQVWRRFDENRQQHARSLQLWIRDLKKGRNFAKQGRIESKLNEPYAVDRTGRRPVYYFRSASDKEAFVESAEARVAESEEFHEAVAKGNAMFLTERLAADREPEVGDIGVVGQIWVVNVVGERTAIVNINRPTTVTGFATVQQDRSAVVSMTAEDIRRIAETCHNPVPVWVETSEPIEVADGAYVEANLPLVFVGTKTYETAIGGQKTILHAKVFRLEDWIETK